MLRYLGALCALTLLLPASLAAQSLMQVDELRMRYLDGDRPAILWVGGDEAWEAGHIPGARRISLGDVAVSRGEYAEAGSFVLDLPLELDEIRREFEERGVSSDHDVVVVFDAPNRLTQATRVVWTLSVLGMGDRTYLLDGGQPAWNEAGGELRMPTAASEAPEGARFVPFEDAGEAEITTAPDADRVVALGWLAREYRTEGLAIVDARRAASYTGERPEFPGRAGHIPGAGNLASETLLGEDGRMVSSDRIRELLAEAGVEQGDRVVTYCHIGQRASAAWFAATLAGFDAAIYDGSMNEWGRTELPLTAGEGR